MAGRFDSGIQGMAVKMNSRTVGKRGKRQNKGTILVDKVEQFNMLNRVNVKEHTKLKEFFYSLIAKTSSEQRRRISVALAHNLYAPRSILLFLALEPIDIASPILLFSGALSERDIRSIVAKVDLEHMRVIARRDGLEVETICALLRADDENQTLLMILRKNSSAQTNLFEAEKLMAAESDQGQVQSHVPAMQNFAKLIAPKDAPNKVDASDRLLKLANVGGKLQANIQEAARSSQSALSRGEFERRLVAEARADNHQKIGELISKISKLPGKITADFIHQEDVGTFACLLYVIGTSRSIAARVMVMLFPTLGRESGLLTKVMRAYDNIDYSVALSFFQSVESGFAVSFETTGPSAETEQLHRLLQNRRNFIAEEASASQEAVGQHLKFSA